MGIPLLHPWANRLAGWGYTAGGREVELDPDSPLLHADENGLPIHGVVGPKLSWTDLAEAADGEAAVLVAEHDFADEALLAVFPFPHRLRQETRLERSSLTLTTTLTPSGSTSVPISFG